ncbi:hypothetical protein [Deinococcus sp. 12RED42]|uniref:hypothetical protein n=1 Tax=Deinococcus sp. 12RED42 TaxID=2745872 RepID=UPI001E5FB700|nr:hypothetical protein [Deinococcus sp. 12RED42]MCD0164237.1 hypothetical protein [Deinococcus sp. 12RED42]
MITLLLKAAARQGLTTATLGTLGDSQQQIRHVTHLLPQVWGQFDAADQKELYDLACKQSAQLRLSARDCLKVLSVIRQVLREVTGLVRREGVMGVSQAALEYQQVHQALLDLIIALYEGRQAQVAAERDEAAALAILPDLQARGVRFMEVDRGADRSLTVRCFITPEIEYEYEPTHATSVQLMKAVNASGGWVSDVEFIPMHAE